IDFGKLRREKSSVISAYYKLFYQENLTIRYMLMRNYFRELVLILRLPLRAASFLRANSIFPKGGLYGF
ncbi:MAG: hypothetical protein K0R73_985, partial [Candidatus Midichloriaceae bacterium]|nr:hypothetical protein [Candidatus Midichloriaceae bacterium]